MLPDSRKHVYGSLLILCLLIAGCSSPPARVPLAYEGPATAKNLTRLAESMILVEDRRQDKELDTFIYPNVPDAIRTAMSRELVASGYLSAPLSGSSGESRTMPIAIKVQLLVAGAGVPGHAGKDAGRTAGVLAGPVVGAVVASVETDVIGEVQMRVQVHNVQSGADCEDSLTGVNSLRTIVGNMDSSQTYSKAFGGAVKQAMSNLPTILSCAGITPQ